MGRIFFPTNSFTHFGARDIETAPTLGAVERFPAEPNPRSAGTPTPPLLGLAPITRYSVNGSGSMYWGGRPVYYRPPTPQPPPPAPVAPGLPPAWSSPAPVTTASGGGGAVAPVQQNPASPFPQPAVPSPVATPVSQQNSPTPVVNLPQQSTGQVPVLVSSGGGTQTPGTAPIVAPLNASSAAGPSSSVTVQTGAPQNWMDGVTAWLSGSTSLFNYNVPNALLAGVVVLGFAYFSAGGKRR